MINASMSETPATTKARKARVPGATKGLKQNQVPPPQAPIPVAGMPQPPSPTLGMAAHAAPPAMMDPRLLRFIHHLIGFVPRQAMPNNLGGTR